MNYEKTLKLIYVIAFVLGILVMLFALNAADTTKTKLRYNYMTGEYHYKKSSDIMKYNHMENTWSYEDKKAELKYNPITNKWEYVNEYN